MISLLTRLTLVAGESWLGAHSFSEPLSNIRLIQDWNMGGSCTADVNGLSLINAAPHSRGYLSSKFPLKTNTFQITMGISVTSDQSAKAGDVVSKDPGLILLFSEPTGKPNPPADGDFYGLYPSIDGQAVFFALSSREGKISPSISFGAKSLARIATPLPRGIYWNYLDKSEFEMMLDVHEGRDVHGYIRAKSSDRWTQAFSETLPENSLIDPNSHLILSALNSEMGVGYTISRLYVASQDDTQPGFQRAQTQKSASDIVGASGGEVDSITLVKQLSSILADSNENFAKFYEEQRNFNKVIMSMLETIKGQQQIGKSDDMMIRMTTKMDKMEKSLAANRKPTNEFSRMESMFNKLNRQTAESESSKKNQYYVMVGISLMVVGGMAYVILHMKRLEKKHIL